MVMTWQHTQIEKQERSNWEKKFIPWSLTLEMYEQRRLLGTGRSDQWSVKENGRQFTLSIIEASICYTFS